MDNFKSNIPELMGKHNVRPMDLVHKGMALNTAYRLARGYLDFTMTTLFQLCDILGVYNLNEMIEYKGDGDK